MGHLTQTKGTESVTTPLSEIEILLRRIRPTLGGDEEQLATNLLEAATGLVSDHPALLDLKITASAVAEMRAA